jgi:hypothetical protein
MRLPWEQMQEKSQAAAMNDILSRGNENRMRIPFLLFMIRSRQLYIQ